MFHLKPFELFESIKSEIEVIFISGLNTRKIDLSVEQQVEELSTFIDYKIISFAWNDYKSGLEYLKNNKNCIVVLFSKSCEHAIEFANLIENKKLLFIVEPYNIGTSAKKSCLKAVELGVPSKNVIVGSDEGRGLNIVPNCKFNDSSFRAKNGSRHFGALKFVSQIISNLN